MTPMLAGWLRPLIAGALLISLILALAPDGKSKAPLRFVSGVLMTVLFLRPLVGLDPDALAKKLTEGFRQTAEIEDAAEQQAEAVYDLFIRRETEEYIWSAAENLGIESLGIRVVLRANVDCPCPQEVYLRGGCTEAQKEALSRLLVTELGIPEQRQYWSGSNAD